MQLQHRTITASLADIIRSAIISGELKPGQKLNQDEIATQYRVSRMPVREALRTLEAEGHIKIDPYRDITVTELSYDEIEENFLIRIRLESWATRLACERINDKDLAKLKKILDQMETSKDVSISYLTLNFEFHSQIYQISRMPRLHQIISNLRRIIDPYLFLYLSAFGRIEFVHATHKALYESLKAQDADRSEQLASAHLQQAMEALLSGIIEYDKSH